MERRGSLRSLRGGEKTMDRTLRSTRGVTLCLLALASPRVFAAAPPSSPLPTAPRGAVAGAAYPHRLMDDDRLVLTAAVPAQSLADIQTRPPTAPCKPCGLDRRDGRLGNARGMLSRRKPVSVPHHRPH